MDLLIRPSLFNLADTLLEIDDLLADSGHSFSLFLTGDRMILANSTFLKRWDLFRPSFPRFSLSDFGNKNAMLLLGETRGRFWNWFGEKSPNLSQIVLPDDHSEGKRFLLRVPTGKESSEDPFFLEKYASDFTPKQKESMLLLGRRLRSPARTIVRAFRDEILLEHFFREEIGRDVFRDRAEIHLTKEAVWSPHSAFLRIGKSETHSDRRISTDLLPGESKALVPFRRILYSRVPGVGFHADFPLLFDRFFFGKIRLFRPETKKKDLLPLIGFQEKAQTLSRLLFGIRKNLGDLLPMERETGTGFLTRRSSLEHLGALIEEHRVSETGFGLIGVRLDLAHHIDLMMGVRKVIRYYDEIGHLSPREYVLILPAMRPGSAEGIVERVRDMILGTNRDNDPLLSFGSASYPENPKGPMNLIRSIFLREEPQPLQKSPGST